MKATSNLVNHRARLPLVAAGQTYPNAWGEVDRFRAARGQDGAPDWPQWCFLPLGAAYAIVAAHVGTQRLSLPLIGDVARLGALAAWRVTQGIYRFDPAVYDAVRDTPLSGDIPSEVLRHLPEWCVYLETPEITWGGAAVHGAWAHLEWDANTGGEELRLLADMDTGLHPIALHLGDWPLADALARSRAEAVRAGLAAGAGELAGAVECTDTAASLSEVVEPILSLLLYLCSQAAEIGDGAHQPRNPKPTKTKRGLRLFPADGPTTWEVGVRLGAALRLAYQAEQTGAGGAHAGPRPHMRRAHWHGFWSGPRDGQRKYALRWLPPIPVNLDISGDLPGTIRRVQ